MCRRLAWALLAVPLLAFAPAPKPRDDPKDDLKKLQGTWKPMKVERAGRELPVVAERDHQVVIAGLEWIYHRLGRPPDPRSIVLHPKLNPRGIDIKPGKTSRAAVLVGIYAMDRDTLKVCYSFGEAARPKEFKTERGRDEVLVTYQRQKR
jgi:uncharacterized protein (TIGR03067 family)